MKRLRNGASGGVLRVHLQQRWWCRRAGVWCGAVVAPRPASVGAARQNAARAARRAAAADEAVLARGRHQTTPCSSCVHQALTMLCGGAVGAAKGEGVQREVRAGDFVLGTRKVDEVVRRYF